jgi:hypothetical protein
VVSGLQLPVSTWGLNAAQFQLFDESGRLLAVAHDEAGRTVYDRVFPELIAVPPRGEARHGSGRPGA